VRERKTGNSKVIQEKGLPGNAGGDAAPREWVHPENRDGVLFLFGIQEESARENWRDCRAKPSRVLFRDGVSVFCWGFEAPVDRDDERVIALVEYLGMETLDEAIPSPGTDDGWDVVHDDPATLYTVDQLASHYLDAETVENDETPQNMYGNAKFVTPFNESEYDGCTMWFAVGENQFAKDWVPGKRTIIEVVRSLTNHVVGKKDGRAVVFGEMDQGRRQKKAIKACTAIPLDYDTGIRSAELDAALARLGCVCVRYTSHSHWKTSSDFSLSEIRKFGGEECEPDTELMQRYLREQKHWEEWIVATVVFVGDYHTGDGYVYRVSHDPMPKHRVIVFLREPFVMREQSGSHADAMELWGKIIEAFAAKIGFYFDRACMDPSHLFYLGRHAKDRPYEVSVFGGKPFDWRTLNTGVDDPFEAIGAEFKHTGRKSKTEQGKAIGRWAHKVADGFQVEDFLEDHCPDRIRGSASTGICIECPNDAAHHNPGATSDTGCFAKNADDGRIFVISCRHGSCHGLTMIDMLGLLLESEGLDPALLDDPKYDSIDRGDKAAEEKTNLANASKETLLKAISLFTNATTVPEIDEVLKPCAKASLSPLDVDEILNAIVKQVPKIKRRKLDAQFKLFDAQPKSTSFDDLTEDEDGFVLSYSGSPDFVIQKKSCASVVTTLNDRDGLPSVSMMGKQPVRLRSADRNTYVFDPMTETALWAYVSEHLTMEKVTKDGAEPRDPIPKDIVSQFYHEGSRKALRPSPKRRNTPVFLADGRLLSEQGYRYDPNAGVNHLLSFDFDMPEMPDKITKEAAVKAVEWLKLELLSDFPFWDVCEDGTDGRETGEAHALAMIITHEMRDMIQGHVPINYITKPRSGTGGTLLGELLGLILDGCEPERINYTHDDDEMGKRIFAHVLSGHNMLFFDDVPAMASQYILRCATSRGITDRVLGGSTTATVPNDKPWVITCNNVAIDEQMARRLLFIRLNARRADVGGRNYRYGGQESSNADGSKIYAPTLTQFVIENRGEVIRNILIIIKYWVQIGMPLFKERKRASFEDWSAKVGGVLKSVGVKRRLMPWLLWARGIRLIKRSKLV
jgi:hypothetical protein